MIEDKTKTVLEITPTEKTDEKQLTVEKKSHLFQKGVSGNPNGRPKGTVSIVTALKRKLEEVPPGKEKTYLEYFIEQVMKKTVVEGDVAMMRDVINRIDGMPIQSIDHTSGGEKLGQATVAPEDKLAISDFHEKIKENMKRRSLEKAKEEGEYVEE